MLILDTETVRRESVFTFIDHAPRIVCLSFIHGVHEYRARVQNTCLHDVNNRNLERGEKCVESHIVADHFLSQLEMTDVVAGFHLDEHLQAFRDLLIIDGNYDACRRFDTLIKTKMFVCTKKRCVYFEHTPPARSNAASPYNARMYTPPERRHDSLSVCRWVRAHLCLGMNAPSYDSVFESRESRFSHSRIHIPDLLEEEPNDCDEVLTFMSDEDELESMCDSSSQTDEYLKTPTRPYVTLVHAYDNFMFAVFGRCYGQK